MLLLGSTVGGTAVGGTSRFDAAGEWLRKGATQLLRVDSLFAKLAVRRYRLAGFTLHPTMLLWGGVPREVLFSTRRFKQVGARYFAS